MFSNRWLLIILVIIITAVHYRSPFYFCTLKGIRKHTHTHKIISRLIMQRERSRTLVRSFGSFMLSDISAQNEIHCMLLILSKTNLNQIIPPASYNCPETTANEILHSHLQSGSWDESKQYIRTFKLASQTSGYHSSILNGCKTVKILFSICWEL